MLSLIRVMLTHLSSQNILNIILSVALKKKHVFEHLFQIPWFSEVAAAENQTPHKTVEPVAKIHKILKFRLALDNDDGETRPTTL